MTESIDPFWEQPDVVEEFASREPDHRLVSIIGEFATPVHVCVLDLGCAGGRNTEFLAMRGFDVHAIDPSRAMVDRSRARIVPLLGRAEAKRRVRRGYMQDLSRFGDASVDLVVALGVYHNAVDTTDWERSVGETCRVLKPGGRVLLSNFSPRSEPEGRPLVPVPGADHLFDGFQSGPLYLLEADILDARLGALGLRPLVPTETVKAATENGYRLSVNGLYTKT